MFTKFLDGFSFKGRKVVYSNRFICTRSKTWFNRKEARKKGGKKLWNQWSMSWLYLISQTLRVTWAWFWQSLCSFICGGKTRDVPQLYPRCYKQKHKNNVTLCLSGATPHWLFFAIRHILRLFQVLWNAFFIGWVVLYQVPSHHWVKESRILSLSFFCQDVRAGNIYSFSHQRSCKFSFSTKWFWYVFCSVSEKWDALWLNRAADDLNKKAKALLCLWNKKDYNPSLTITQD